jgi:predicted DNA-binding transcriptional regulator AlpA
MGANYPDRVVREPERRKITGLSSSSWYALPKNERPQSFTLTGRTVGWSFNELTEWVEARKAARDDTDTWQQIGDVAAKVAEKVRP